MHVDQKTKDRFWSKVHKTDGCWLWTSRAPKYGMFRVGNELRLAHRVAWELTNGSIPVGMCVCHSCDNPVCVNPTHLFTGTNHDNSKDAVRKGRQAKGEKLSWLTDDQVEGILHRLRNGESDRSIARNTGVSRVTVYRIKGGKVWSHLTGVTR